MGLRLQLRKQQAEAGDIVLLYGDESEALTHPYHLLSKKPLRNILKNILAPQSV